MVIAEPSPTVDRLIGIDRLDPGYIHRAAGVEARFGGGGVNAARVAARLGADPTLVTVIPSEDEARLLDELGSEGVAVAGIRRPGRTRTATILREEAGRTSVLHEPGARLDVAGWEELAKVATTRLATGRILLCSGSLPPGAPSDGYARMAREARHLGCRCVVDAAGDTLAETIDAHEGIVVPNLSEAECALHGPGAEAVCAGDAPDRAQEVAADLLRAGAHIAVVTAGAAGAAYAERGPRGACGWVPAPSVKVESPVGAGDAFAAGLAFGLERQGPLASAVRLGVASAAVHIERGPGSLRFLRALTSQDAASAPSLETASREGSGEEVA